MTRIDGVTFDDAWRDRHEIELFGQKIPVISKKCLIGNKKATGRIKDRLDVLALEGKD